MVLKLLLVCRYTPSLLDSELSGSSGFFKDPCLAILTVTAGNSLSKGLPFWWGQVFLVFLAVEQTTAEYGRGGCEGVAAKADSQGSFSLAIQMRPQVC